MTSLRISLIGATVAAVALIALSGCQSGSQGDDLDAFLMHYNTLYHELWTKAEGARWDSNVDICDSTSALRIAAEKEFAEKLGAADIIEKARGFAKRGDLTFEQRQQLRYVILNAAKYPGTIPQVTQRLIRAEAAQNELLYGFQYTVTLPDGTIKPTTPNEIDEVLLKSHDLPTRHAYWEASKDVGPTLRKGLVELRDLRNETAQSMGFGSYFDMQVSEYGMSTEEMMALMNDIIAGIRPLYQQLHCWVRYKLAERYDQPVPQLIPADWLGNRWAQAWPGIVEGIDLDALVADQTPEWIVHQGERYYISMGFPVLPQTFWDRSDLYQLPPDSPRKKNTHASAWHIDLDQDVRSLMSITPTFEWFQTAHHELGHIYYYLAYSRPEVPYLLRTGANRAFHEGIGSLIELVSSQSSYLQEIGLLDPGDQPDQIKWLLNQALVGPVTFLPFACGTMTGWEHDFYDEPLQGGQMNKRWWELAAEYQGIAPPEEREENWCDPATKTHINDDAAQYYDYALSSVILHQLHDHICREILHQPPQTATYYDNKQVGAYLENILRVGATEDWRQLMRDATGEDLSSRALLEYFAPLQKWLEEQNKGRSVGF